MSRPSIEAVRAEITLERALDLDKMQWMSEVLGASLPVAPAGRARQPWLAAKLRDPEFVRARVRELPVSCLVVLALCMERGGQVASDEVTGLLSGWGGPPELWRAAYAHLVGVGLGWAPLHDSRVFAAFREPLWSVRDLLAGLLDADARPPRAARGRSPGRDLAATVGLLVHRPLRITQQGTVDRAKLRTFVKGNGLDPELVERRIVLARYFGLVRFGDQRLDVDLEVACEFLSREGHVALLTLFHGFGVGWVSEREMRTPLGARTLLLTATETIEHEGTLYGRPPTLKRPGGDGHVTPSFEVLLGPEADAALTLVVGMVADLKHADHLLTYKLTPDSLARGLAAGVPVSTVRAELERVSARPLPDTVRSLLDDAERRTARARTVIAIEASPSVLDSLAATLGAVVFGRPSRDCLLVDARSTAVLLAAQATTTGVVLDTRGLQTTRSSGDADVLPPWQEEMREHTATARTMASMPLHPRQPDAKLRARFEQAVERRFADDREALLGKMKGARSETSPVMAAPASAGRTKVNPRREIDSSGTARSVASSIASWDRAAEIARKESRHADARYLALVAEAVRAVEAEVVAWAHTTSRSDHAARLLDDEEVGMFAFLAPHWRRAVLAVANDPEHVLEGSEVFDGPNARTALGRKAHLEVRGRPAPLRSGGPAAPQESFDEDGIEVREVCRLPMSSIALRALVERVMDDHDATLRVTELRGSDEKTFVLFPEGVRTRGGQDVVVGETEDGATRVVEASAIRRLEVVSVE